MANNNNTTDYWVTVALWTLAITIILILLFNAQGIADALFTNRPLNGCHIAGGC